MNSQYSSQGVNIIEVFDPGIFPNLSISGWAAAEYPLFISTTPDQMQSDWGAGWEGFPTSPLINAQTMEVLEKDCFNRLESCITTHL